MAKVNICDVTVLDNPSPFKNPFQFEITFECLEDLTDDLEWRILYVGSAESEDYDQVLDTVLVGPLVSGRHKFVFQAEPPNCDKIPVGDAVGVTVVLLTCGYKNQEFIRVGYYVNNEYADPEFKENPPTSPEYEKMTRNILATCPRVTRFRIDWGDSSDVPAANENAENQPPAYNTETESNQMALDVGGGGDSLGGGSDSRSKTDSNAPLSSTSEKPVVNGNHTDTSTSASALQTKTESMDGCTAMEM